MRQVWITKHGAPEVLQVRDAPDPEPGQGQVRVRVEAAGINFADLMARVGLYPDAPKPPMVVGYEVSGRIDKLGPGAKAHEVGARVFAMPRFGGYSDLLVVPEAQAIAMPPSMSFEEGAALPVVYLTAYCMMLFTGNLREGSSVLIHSAAGGVGLAAIQIAKTRGCTIFGVASPGKHEFLREQGVQHPVATEGYAATVRSIVGDRGIDLVLDAVGGRSWTEGYDLLAPCGRLVAFGMSAAAVGETRSLLHALAEFFRIKRYSPMDLMDKNRSVTGVNMGHLFARLDLLRPQFEALIEMYVAKQIAPHVDRSFPFSEAAAAHRYIHERKAKGKVLLVP